MKYTAGQAAKATGLATATITRALKSGKISGIKDESGAWSIDPAELHRVFPPLSQKGVERPDIKDTDTPDEIPEKSVEMMALQREVQILRDALSDTREDRDKWRDMAERLSIAPPSQPVPKIQSWWPWNKRGSQ